MNEWPESFPKQHMKPSPWNMMEHLYYIYKKKNSSVKDSFKLHVILKIYTKIISKCQTRHTYLKGCFWNYSCGGEKGSRIKQGVNLQLLSLILWTPCVQVILTFTLMYLRVYEYCILLETSFRE